MADINRLPVACNINAYRGDDVTVRLLLRSSVDGGPWDPTGCTARSQIRPTPDSDEQVGDLVVFINTEDAWIDLMLTSVTSRALPRVTAWDCELTTPSGAVLTLAAGAINLTQDVTR